MVQARWALGLAAIAVLACAASLPASARMPKHGQGGAQRNQQEQQQDKQAPADAAPAPAPAPSAAEPPRTITDILSLLSTIKPDPTFGRRLRERANAEPLPGLAGPALAAFYFNRGSARSDLGDSAKAAADFQEAVRIEEGIEPPAPTRLNRYLVRFVSEESYLGNHVAELAAAEKRAQLRPDNGGAAVQLALARLHSGDIAGAEQAAIHAADLAASQFAATSGVSANDAVRAQSDAGIALMRAQIDYARGRYAEAEAQWRLAIERDNVLLANFGALPAGAASRGFYERRLSTSHQHLAFDLAIEHRYADAEVEGRETLIATLKRLGADNSNAAREVLTLAGIVSQAGRQREAEQLAKTAIGIYAGLGLSPTDGAVASARSALGVYQARAREFDAAAATYASLKSDLLAAGDREAYDRILGTSTAFAMVEARAGRASDAVEIEQRCVDKLAQRLGDGNFWTANCRGYLGIALSAAGRDKEALAAFRTAIPVLVAEAGDDPASIEVRDVQIILRSYLKLLDRIRGSVLEPKRGDAATEAFAIADAARTQALQQTLAEATARMSLPDAALADLARREQDAGNELRELDRLLLEIASAPPDQQDVRAVAGLQQNITHVGAERAALRQQIAQRSPRYAELLSPHGATVAQARALLRPDEALVAITSLDDRTLVWALAKDGPLAYAAAPVKASDLEFSVTLLRHALDAHATTLGAIPPFDVARAYKLYQELLEPVAAAWRGKKTLIVVAGGPLAEIPLTVLVTRAVPQPQDRDGAPLFAGYRDVPFLVRDVAVTELPSVAALGELRELPPGGTRRPFVGFGDPLFNAQEVADAERSAEPPAIQLASRGGPVRLRAGPGTEDLASAGLGELPRLPDTAEELREVALSLGADPKRDIFLGEKASEETVETMRLDDRRVVMFATHGLVPGDINGLTQPALALSPPAIAGGRGDGLLTASKILGLKLDADWVVLSACNTGAAGGAGARAVSGLGGAFFYAGARALLVTNWPVETVSARLLTTGTFRHQAADATRSRAEALRQTELDLIDNKGAVNAEGRTVYAYAHPIFWAPFSLIGD